MTSILERLPFNSEGERRVRADTLYWCRHQRSVPDDLPPEDPYPSACPDCGVETGELHDLGCDVEQCPEHEGQLLACPDECELSGQAWDAGL